MKTKKTIKITDETDILFFEKKKNKVDKTPVRLTKIKERENKNHEY